MPQSGRREGGAKDGRVRRPDFEQELAAISADNRTGAVSLARRAALALWRFSQDAQAADEERFRALMGDAATALVDAQPAMAPMVHLANGVLFELESGERLKRLRQRTGAFCRNFARELEASGGRIALNAAKRLPRKAVVMVHSYSQTVQDALIEARRAGRLSAVYCTESRPMMEGVDLARQLAAAKVPVTLIVDSAAVLHMPVVDAVLVGADSVMPEGVINKIGTTMLALAAKAFHKPFWVLCDGAKFRAPGCVPPPERSHDPAEVASPGGLPLDVENFYFERTPMRLISAIITEHGVLSSVEARRRCGGIRNHERLCGGRER